MFAAGSKGSLQDSDLALLEDANSLIHHCGAVSRLLIQNLHIRTPRVCLQAQSSLLGFCPTASVGASRFYSLDLIARLTRALTHSSSYHHDKLQKGPAWKLCCKRPVQVSQSWHAAVHSNTRQKCPKSALLMHPSQ